MDSSRAPETLSISAVTVLLALVGSSCGLPSESTLLQPGEKVPTLLHAGDKEVSIAWILRGEHLFGCDPGTSGVRQLQRQLGSSLQFVAVVAEDPDDRLSALLRRERLSVSIARADRRDVRSAMGYEKLPALVLVVGGRIGAVWSSGRVSVAPELGTPADSLVAVVRRALASSETLPNQWPGSRGRPTLKEVSHALYQTSPRVTRIVRRTPGWRPGRFATAVWGRASSRRGGGVQAYVLQNSLLGYLLLSVRKRRVLLPEGVSPEVKAAPLVAHFRNR